MTADMQPGNVLTLIETVTAKSSGVIVRYKLGKKASLPVLVLPKDLSPGKLTALRAVLGVGL